MVCVLHVLGALGRGGFEHTLVLTSEFVSFSACSGALGRGSLAGIGLVFLGEGAAGTWEWQSVAPPPIIIISDWDAHRRSREARLGLRSPF